MRTAFIETLCQAAERDERIWLICGDLGYSVLEQFATRFPDRFLNAGVAEQNMIGVAAGLALCGKTVFVYSIVNFPVMRCLEQIRNDVCYHNLNVKIVAVGGGLVYGGHGYTHHGAEDLAVLRVLPHMTVLAPGDPVETRLVTEAATTWAGPCYLRLGRGGEATVHATAPPFTIGRALTVRPGIDVTLLSTGGALGLTIQAADLLATRGIDAGVVSMPTLAPLDSDSVRTAATGTGRLVTVEEHGLGGLGTAVAEVLAQAGILVRFKPLRLRREPVETAGSHENLRSGHGLDMEQIAAAAAGLLEAAPEPHLLPLPTRPVPQRRGA
jgi:transketolase